MLIVILLVLLVIVAIVAILILSQRAQEFQNSADYHKRALEAHMKGCPAYGETVRLSDEAADNIMSD